MPQNQDDTKKYLQLATQCAIEGIERGCGPFGAVIVKNGEVLATANNQVTQFNDPTAHAEVQAIRQACAKLGSFNLQGCQMYTSCWPCPMCASSCMWARIDNVYSALLPRHAAVVGFDDHRFWDVCAQMGTLGAEKGHPKKDDMPSFEYVDMEGANAPFELWKRKDDKIHY